MKLETKKQIEFATNSSFESIDATISSTDMHKLWDMLQNPYKDNISSIVRECTSNSFDAHAEAMFIKEHSLEEIRAEYGIYNTVEDKELLLLKQHVAHCNNDAVAVSLEKDQTGWYWSTEDVGVGLSPSRVRTVFVNYLKSTKELSNTMIGAFGLGSKSPLSYSDVFFIRTRYNSIEYNYMLRKGENGPALDVISEEPTTEKNGTEIKIYLNTENDIRLFRTACEKQLAYFNNVYFSYNTYVNNEYQIIKGDNWVATTKDKPYSGLHICLGTVAYPIDWNILEMSSIDLPIALQFEIGELDVIQTREDVKYTPRTKEAILAKIIELRKELKNRWNQVDKQCTSIEEYYDKREIVPTLSFLNNAITFRIKDFIGMEHSGYYYKPFKDAGLVDKLLPSYRNGIFFEYLITGQFQARFQSQNWQPDFSNFKNGKIYRITGTHEPKKSKFILETNRYNSILLLRKQKKSLKDYKHFLKLNLVHKSQWRTIISTYQKEIQKLVVSLTTSYDKTVITQEWLDSQKQTRAKKDNTVIKVVRYDLSASPYSHPFNASWSAKVTEFLQKPRNTFIVGTQEDKQIMRLIHNTYAWFTKTPGKFLTRLEVAPTNIKKLKDVRNLVTKESFMSEDNTVFRRTMSFLKLHKTHKREIEIALRAKYNKYDVLKHVCPSIVTRYKYFESIFNNFQSLLDLDKNTKFLSETCYALAEQNDLWDLKFEQEFLQVIKDLKLVTLNFIDLDDYNEYRSTKSQQIVNTKVIDFVFDYLYMKKNMDPKYKAIPLNLHMLITARGKHQTPKKVKTPKVNVETLLKEEVELTIN
jgi:hypothetical protein